MPAQPKRAAIVKTGKAALAIAAPEAAVPLAAAEAVKGVLTGDIVVVRETRNVGTKKNPVWREVETHYNAVAVGGGLLLVAFGAGVAAIAWEGVSLPFGGQTPAVKDNIKRFLDAHPLRKKPIESPATGAPTNFVDVLRNILFPH